MCRVCLSLSQTKTRGPKAKASTPWLGQRLADSHGPSGPCTPTDTLVFTK